MDSDLTYLENLIATGQEFTYRRARAQHEFDPMLESSKEKWIEWMTMAEMAVKTSAARDSEALELIRKAKHLEVVGEIADDFYKSRELALSALRMCARDLQTVRQSDPVENGPLEELRKLYAQRDQLKSTAAGKEWLEQVSGLLHRLAPARAQEFDHLTPYLLTRLSVHTMEPIWHKVRAIVQAAIVETERSANVSGPVVEAGSHASEIEQRALAATQSPTDTQKKLLQFVYDYMVQTGDWPPTRLVGVEIRHDGRLEDLCRQIGTDLIVCNFGSRPQDVCALRLGALEHLEGAERDVRNVLRGVAYLVDRYINAVGEPSASNRDFVTALGMTEPEARRVAAFLQYCSIWSGYSSSDVDTWGHGTLSDYVLELEHIDGLEGLLGQLRSRRRVLPSQGPPLATTGARVSSVDDSGMEDVPPTFWDRYGRPIIIGVVSSVIAGLVAGLLAILG